MEDGKGFYAGLIKNLGCPFSSEDLLPILVGIQRPFKSIREFF